MKTITLSEKNTLPEFSGKTILVSPLNWGLGHATRLIPIIRNYHETNSVILAGNHPSLNVLTQVFPDLKAIELPEQNFTFDPHFFSVKNLFRFSRQLNQSTANDRKILEKIVKENNIDIIISDNRYGLWHPDTYNILITHQLMLKLPEVWRFAEKKVHKTVIKKIKRFDECWIPDFEAKKNLSGDLSHKYPLPENAIFIGPLSRFDKPVNSVIATNHKILVILSGPEPQRTAFEQRIKRFLTEKKLPATILLGKPAHELNKTDSTLTVIPHCNDSEFYSLVENHSIVIARAGYSTIMDFYFLQKQVILVPTPKQTEQLYLAEHLKNHPLFSFVDEEHLETQLLG